MPVRLALGIALALVAGALALDMSGRAPRLAGTDHVNPQAFSAGLAHGGVLCQPGMTLPGDAQRVTLLIGTYGRAVPALAATFARADGAAVTAGGLAAGAREGYVTIPLRYPHGATATGTLCLRVAGREKVVLGGEPFTAGPLSERVDGTPQAGRIDLVYLRPGRESWWQLLGALDRRFGLGKASLFGDWTLPAMALALLGVWIATVRLLARELT